MGNLNFPALFLFCSYPSKSAGKFKLKLPTYQKFREIKIKIAKMSKSPWKFKFLHLLRFKYPERYYAHLLMTSTLSTTLTTKEQKLKGAFFSWLCEGFCSKHRCHPSSAFILDPQTEAMAKRPLPKKSPFHCSKIPQKVSFWARKFKVSIECKRSSLRSQIL